MNDRSLLSSMLTTLYLCRTHRKSLKHRALRYNIRMKHLYNRFRHACRGITHALCTDRSYRLQVVAGGVIVLIVSYVFHPLSELEAFFLLLSWVLVLITELQNSSFEAALDKIHPELHDQIGKSKDMAAGAVLTAGLFALFVVVMILVNHLG